MGIAIDLDSYVRFLCVIPSPLIVNAVNVRVSESTVCATGLSLPPARIISSTICRCAAIPPSTTARRIVRGLILSVTLMWKVKQTAWITSLTLSAGTPHPANFRQRVWARSVRIPFSFRYTARCLASSTFLVFKRFSRWSCSRVAFHCRVSSQTLTSLLRDLSVSCWTNTSLTCKQPLSSRNSPSNPSTFDYSSAASISVGPASS